MQRALMFIVPSLTIGAAGGFVLGRAQAVPASRNLGHSGHLAESQQTQASESGVGPTARIDYERIAAACARGASKGNFGAPAPGGSALSRDQEEAHRQLLAIEERALTEGEWTQFSGIKAQRLVGELPAEVVDEVAQRLREEIKSGALVLQDGAWLPGNQGQ